MGTATKESKSSNSILHALSIHKLTRLLLVFFILTISALTGLYVSPPGIKAPIWVKNVDGNAWLQGGAMDANGSRFVVGTQTGPESGALYFFDSDGTLLWKHTTDRGISSVAISSDGAYIVAGGYQLSAGYAQFYQNGAIYCLNNKGDLLWSTTTGSQPVGQVKISSNGSRILATYTSGIVFLDNAGRILWNHTVAESGSLFGSGDINEAAMSKDGSYILTGENSLRLRNQTSYEWSLVFFNARGSVLWNYTSSDGLGIYGLSLSEDGGYVAAGVGRMGYHSTLLFFDRSGTLLWSKQVYSNLLSSQVSNGGSVAASTNVDLLYYNQTGNLLWNYTGPSVGPSPTMTADGHYVLGTAWADFGPSALLFDAEGKVIWSFEAGTVHGSAISEDGASAIIASGPTVGGPTTLYFFSRIQNGNLVAATEAWYFTTLRQPILFFFEIGVAGLGLIIISVAALRLRRRSNEL